MKLNKTDLIKDQEVYVYGLNVSSNAKINLFLEPTKGIVVYNWRTIKLPKKKNNFNFVSRL